MMHLRNNWITLLLLIGMFFAALTGWSVYQAVCSSSQIIDRDYSRQRQPATQDEYRDVVEADWVVQIFVTPPMLRVKLTDASGTPVRGAAGRIDLFDPENRTETDVLPLLENEAGMYLGSLPAELDGEINGMLSFRLDNKLYRKKLAIFL